MPDSAAASTCVLAQFAAQSSDPFPAAGNLPMFLEDPQTVWYVEHGAMEVFTVEMQHGRMVSSLQNALRAESGRLAFGIDPRRNGTALRFFAKGLPDTRLRRLSVDALLEEIGRNEPLRHAVSAQVDAWVVDFGASAVRDIMTVPRIAVQLVPGTRTEVDGAASARRGVVWVPCQGLDATFLDLEDPESGEDMLIPVTQDTWITAPRPAEVVCRTSREIDTRRLLLELLPEFQRLAIRTKALGRQLLMVDDANQQMARVASRRREETEARRALSSLLGAARAVPDDDRDVLVAALVAIGRHEGIDIRLPEIEEGRALDLREIVERSRLRARRVRLAAETGWWRGDSGAMLAFRREDDRPVVLVPSGLGVYTVLDPGSGESVRAGPHTAHGLHEYAWCFYHTIQRDGPAGLGDAVHVVGGHMASDLVRLAVAGVAAGLLTLTPAVAAGLLVDYLIPSGAGATLALFSTALAGIGLVAALAHVFSGTALMRIEGRVTARLGALLWDRMLRLPLRFFRRHTGGDLAMRVMAFQHLRDVVAGPAIRALISLLFLLPALLVLFVYDAALGVLTMAIGIAAILVTVAFGYLQLDPQRRYYETTRELIGILHQIVNGVGKLRSARAESSAFAFWARWLHRQQEAWIRISRLNEHLSALTAALPALAGAALFAVALQQGAGELSVADFVAVYTASMAFYGSIVLLGLSIEAVAAIVPVCEQVGPILDAGPDTTPQGTRLVTLGGEIRFDRVSFRYGEDGPLVLRDVSIHARPGELIAIAGESGGGKSTLIRLALGLESPVAGGIYYDDRNLDSLDAASVRRQVGVVVQDGDLSPGNVLDNIIGVTEGLTIDDAWRAARAAGIEGEILNMPMGMYTPVAESAATFSGGQGQRLRIAAALVRNPRILFLDEATSWLDASSQNETMEGINRLTATRIVIAHRLSTIRDADRIYVLEDGQVVQQGDFETLLATPGPFRRLAERQMA